MHSNLVQTDPDLINISTDVPVFYIMVVDSLTCWVSVLCLLDLTRSLILHTHSLYSSAKLCSYSTRISEINVNKVYKGHLNNRIIAH